MEKQKKQLLYLIGGVIIFVVFVNVSFGLYLQKQQSHIAQTASTVTSDQSTSKESFSHRGKEGVDTLTLLRKHTSVEQNTSGLVVTIDGRRANDKKREFWAFYVNGKMASVGPAEYVTKETDKIEWKIEKY